MRLTDNIRIIGKNFSYLSILKLFSIATKFFLFAYLLKILGADTYGQLVWSDSIIQYLIIFINFGFNVYAATLVIKFQKRRLKLNQLFSSIIQIKTILFVASIIIIFLLTSFNLKIGNVSDLLYLLILTGIGEILFPIWYFQGIEKLKPATLIVLSSRIIIVILTIIFVKDHTDVLLYASISVIGTTIMGVIGIWFVINKYQISFKYQKWIRLFYYIKDASMFFLGRFMAMAFTSISIFIVGYYLTMESVTVFDWSLKLIAVAVIPFEMLTQALFPTISRTKDKRLLLKSIWITLGLSFLITVGVLSFANELLRIIGIDNISYAKLSVQLLAILIPFIAVSFLLGISSLVAFGFNREYNRTLIISSSFFLLGVFTLVSLSEVTLFNVILLRIFADILLMALRLRYVLKLNILRF